MSQCLLFKNGVHVDTGSRWKVCCGGTGDGLRPNFDTYKEYKQYSADAYERSKTAWVEGCAICKYGEDTKNHSLRLDSNRALQYEKPLNKNIIRAILNTGSTCNLSCRMCGPGCSSKWVSSLKNNSHKFTTSETKVYAKDMGDPGVKVYNQETMDQIYENVLTPELRYVSFAGGEPTQNYRTEEIIQYLIEKGYARNMTMHIITNATRPFKDSWKDALDEFKEVEIGVSMDGTHDNYNYIRQGANFDEVMENILDIKDQMIKKGRDLKKSLGITYCLQALNAHKFLYDKDYYESKGLFFDYQIIHYPKHMTLECIPAELIEKYKLKDIYPIMYNKHLLDKFAGSQRWMDTMFNKLGEFEKQCPDLFKYANVKDIYSNV